MITQDKTYRTRSGAAVRIYATDGAPPYPVQGATLDNGQWYQATWDVKGSIGFHNHPHDLIPPDPHGILPRHRELLASVYEGQLYDDKADFDTEGKLFTNFLKTADFSELAECDRCALIALAKLDNERGGV